MNSIYKEQIVKRQNNSVDKLKKVGVVIIGIILTAVGTMFFQQFGVFIALGIVYGIYYMFQRFDVEYEYVFTNGDLDIDKIFAKAKRKKGLAINVKQFEIMAAVKDKQYERQVERADKVLDFSKGQVLDSTYVAIFSKDGKRTKLIFDPNEVLLESIKQYIPNKLKWKKYGNF